MIDAGIHTFSCYFYIFQIVVFARAYSNTRFETGLWYTKNVTISFEYSFGWLGLNILRIKWQCTKFQDNLEVKPVTNPKVNLNLGLGEKSECSMR